MQIDPRIEPYIRALEEEGESWRVRPSTSQYVLMGLYSKHGRDVVDTLLDEYWVALRAEQRAKKDAR